MAWALSHAGYTVTVNRPSPRLRYDPGAFDLLAFGGTTYMGGVGKPLVEYLATLRFEGKRVLLYVLGEDKKAPELAGLRLCVPMGNTVQTIKVRAGEGEKLGQFAVGEG